tara:strand:+ start:390 stop:1016 length:627 start_codon:yes stop_codon:yes gene_type:complete
MNRQALETGFAFLAPLIAPVAGFLSSSAAAYAASGVLVKMVAQIGISLAATEAVSWLISGFESPEQAEGVLQAESAQNGPLTIGARALYLKEWDNWAMAAKKHVPEPALTKVIVPAWQEWRRKNIESPDATLVSYQDAARAMQFLIDRYGSDIDIQGTIAKTAKPNILNDAPGTVGSGTVMFLNKYGVYLGLAGAAGVWYMYSRRSAN